MEERPNVTVVYQTVPSNGPGLGAILIELLTFLALAFAIGGGCMLK